MTLNENLNSAADEQKAKLADGFAGEITALSDEELEQVSGGSGIRENTRDVPSVEPPISEEII